MRRIRLIPSLQPLREAIENRLVAAVDLVINRVEPIQLGRQPFQEALMIDLTKQPFSLMPQVLQLLLQPADVTAVAVAIPPSERAFERETRIAALDEVICERP